MRGYPSECFLNYCYVEELAKEVVVWSCNYLGFLSALAFPWSFVYLAPFLCDSDLSLKVSSLERSFLAIFQAKCPPWLLSTTLPSSSTLCSFYYFLTYSLFYLLFVFGYCLSCLIRILAPWNQGVGCILGMADCWDMAGNSMNGKEIRDLFNLVPLSGRHV